MFLGGFARYLKIFGTAYVEDAGLPGISGESIENAYAHNTELSPNFGALVARLYALARNISSRKKT